MMLIEPAPLSPRWMRITAMAMLAVLANAAAPQVLYAADTKPTASLIDRGSEYFDEQRYEESIQTLSAALLRPTTSHADKVEIYRLLAYNYITLGRTDEADAAVRGLLCLDETFRLPSSESPRFRDFFDATREAWVAAGKPGRVDAASSGAPLVKIEHASPPQTQAGEVLKLSGSVADAQSVVGAVELNYRAGSKGKFVTIQAAYSMGDFRAQVPANQVKPPFVEYYIQALDGAGLPLASRGDAESPLRVVVPDPSKGGGGVLTSPWFWIPVGVVVVGGAVATALILSNSGSGGAGGAGGGGGGSGGGSGGGTSTVTIGIHE